jgi:hypothetical protein
MPNLIAVGNATVERIPRTWPHRESPFRPRHIRKEEPAELRSRNIGALEVDGSFVAANMLSRSGEAHICAPRDDPRARRLRPRGMRDIQGE